MYSISFCDNCGYDHQHPGKNRDQDDNERCINNLDQELSFPSEWEEFLKNENGKNKIQLVNLLVNLIKDGAVGNDVYVNRGNNCYFRKNNGTWIPFLILDSSHREADLVIPLHSVYAGSWPEDTICIVADDTYICLSLIHISHEIKSNVFFRQGKVNDKDGITFHDVKSIADSRYIGARDLSNSALFLHPQRIWLHIPILLPLKNSSFQEEIGNM